MEIFFKIRTLFLFASFIPLVVGIIRYKYLNKALRILFYLICLGALSEMFLQIIVYLGYTTLWFFNIYIPIEFILVSLMYHFFLINKISRKTVYLVIVLFVSFSLINSLFFQDFQHVNNYVMIVRSIIFIIYSILYFYRILFDLKIDKIWDEPAFWVNISILFVYSSMFFILSFSNYILTLPIDVAKFFLGLPVYFYGIGYILMAIGLLKVKDNRQHKMVE